MPKKFPPALVVDFDGTITVDSVGYTNSPEETAEPKPEMVELLKKAHAAGIKITIHTCRLWPQEDEPEKVEKQKKLITEYCAKHEIPFDDLQGKPFGEAYIDDKGVPANDFQHVNTLIERVKKDRGGVKVEANDAKRDFGCLMVDAPQELAKALQDWGKANIDDADVYDEDARFGREKQSHVTVNFGFVEDPDPAELQSNISELLTKPIKITLGQVSKFTPDKGLYDVIKVEVYSEGLDRLHAELLEKYEIKDEHPEYKPHMTLAYVKPGSCDDLIGNTDFMDQEYAITDFDYSGKDSGHNKFNIQPSKAEIKSALVFSNGQNPKRTPEELSKAKAAGLVHFNKEVLPGGLKCGNCQFFDSEKSYCTHTALQMTVEADEECCNFWFSPEADAVMVGKEKEPKPKLKKVEGVLAPVIFLRPVSSGIPVSAVIKKEGLKDIAEKAVSRFKAAIPVWKDISIKLSDDIGDSHIGKYDDGTENSPRITISPKAVLEVVQTGGSREEAVAETVYHELAHALFEKARKECRNCLSGLDSEKREEAVVEDFAKTFEASGDTTAEMQKVIEALKDLETPVKAVLFFPVWGDKLTDFYKIARDLVENDPKWKPYLDDPAVAQEYGSLQSELKDARDEATIRRIWKKYNPTSPLPDMSPQEQNYAKESA